MPRYTVKQIDTRWCVIDTDSGKTVADAPTRSLARIKCAEWNDHDAENREPEAPEPVEFIASKVTTWEEFNNPRNAWANFTSLANSAGTPQARDYWQAKADKAHEQMEAEA